MKDFFDLLNEFLKSDLAISYWWFFVVAMLLLIVITAYLTWLFLSKVYYKIQLNEIVDVKNKMINWLNKFRNCKQKMKN